MAFHDHWMFCASITASFQRTRPAPLILRLRPPPPPPQILSCGSFVRHKVRQLSVWRGAPGMEGRAAAGMKPLVGREPTAWLGSFFFFFFKVFSSRRLIVRKTTFSEFPQNSHTLALLESHLLLSARQLLCNNDMKCQPPLVSLSRGEVTVRPESCLVSMTPRDDESHIRYR